jgi:hypothetical protein
VLSKSRKEGGLVGSVSSSRLWALLVLLPWGSFEDKCVAVVGWLFCKPVIWLTTFCLHHLELLSCQHLALHCDCAKNPFLNALVPRLIECQNLSLKIPRDETQCAAKMCKVFNSHLQVPTSPPDWATVYEDPSAPLTVDIGCGEYLYFVFPIFERIKLVSFVCS